ncbi:predicted protein [Naegleria gruberi]|uniref:Predicted protein n=1 Tax=Naegleria gruberi TaxID=5762 RepID=D2W503_NAEGR|nr:uncharacterized protein NAEGRDRAFT_76491 [Naegleria gruberi]EFC35854.1 predicted protein [Naegleria gruberi]|eukprot:XP_002668598.1 predicted protein [Naegleria gruberi strain NEG-M]
MGIVYLFTFGLCGVGQIFDVLLIPGLVAQENGTSSNNNGLVFGFGNNMFSGGNYVNFNNAQPYQVSNGNAGYSQYYVNDGQQQPQSYVPPQQQEQQEGGESNEYVPPQRNSGFTMYINGQPVDLSNGGTIYMDGSGEAQYYANDDDNDDQHFNSVFDNMRRAEENRRLHDSIRRTNESINRSNEIHRENIRRMNENIHRTNEQNRRTNENNMRMHHQNMNRMHDNMRMHQNIHSQNMQRMHQQNTMNNINRMNTFRR